MTNVYKVFQYKVSLCMTKPTKWPVRPAKTQISLGICHLPSLIRVFAVHSMDSKGPKVSSCIQRRLIRLGWCPDRSESSLGTQVILLVLSYCGSSINEWFTWCINRNWLIQVMTDSNFLTQVSLMKFLTQLNLKYLYWVNKKLNLNVHVKWINGEAKNIYTYN